MTHGITIWFGITCPCLTHASSVGGRSAAVHCNWLGHPLTTGAQGKALIKCAESEKAVAICWEGFWENWDWIKGRPSWLNGLLNVCESQF
jgi:hypothetical protein